MDLATFFRDEGIDVFARVGIEDLPDADRASSGWSRLQRPAWSRPRVQTPTGLSSSPKKGAPGIPL